MAASRKDQEKRRRVLESHLERVVIECFNPNLREIGKLTLGECLRS